MRSSLEHRVGEERRIERLLRDIHIGDLVNIQVRGRFFGRNKPELYCGYIASLDGESIGLSPTHHSNYSHGYVHGENESTRQPRAITKIAIELITSCMVINYDQKQSS